MVDSMIGDHLMMLRKKMQLNLIEFVNKVYGYRKIMVGNYEWCSSIRR
jgi:deoxyhypusine synthase